MATSQNGYPALSSASPTLHRWKVPRTQRQFTLRNGSAGFLLCHFILWFHDNVEKLNKEGEVWDEWGYAYRPVRGSETNLSNHSSGTAVDLNATKHVLGKVNTFGPVRRAWIRTYLYFFYRRTIRWGGDYAGRKDEMHFEINKPLTTCEKWARRLMNTPRGREILLSNPGQDKVILS
jgi:hypothetical protein